MTKYRGSGKQKQHKVAFEKPSDKEIKKIMENGDADVLIALADRVGKRLKEENLKTSQIRNVFGTARQIQMRWDESNPREAARAYRDAVLLKPKLAYFAEKQKKAQGERSDGMEILQIVLEPALNILQDGGKPSKDRYDRFMDFFEAIVAYHTKHGGQP
jgi:CRISPR-associated protein Csm2